MNNHNMVLKQLNSYVVSVMDLPELKETHVKLMTLTSYYNKKISGIQKRFDVLKMEIKSINDVLTGLRHNNKPSYVTDGEQEKLRLKQSVLIDFFQEKSGWIASRQDTENMICIIRDRINNVEAEHAKVREKLDLMRLAQGRISPSTDEVDPDHIKEVA